MVAGIAIQIGMRNRLQGTPEAILVFGFETHDSGVTGSDVQERENARRVFQTERRPAGLAGRWR